MHVFCNSLIMNCKWLVILVSYSNTFVTSYLCLHILMGSVKKKQLAGKIDKLILPGIRLPANFTSVKARLITYS